MPHWEYKVQCTFASHILVALPIIVPGILLVERKLWEGCS